MGNMKLPDGKTAILYCVWEAVSNSIHAIEDRFGEDGLAKCGEIKISIETNEDGAVETVTIFDNGAGFNEKNLGSFDTCDSIEKAQRGGKGIGRLIWFKTFKKVSVESQFEESGYQQKVSFDYDPLSENSIQNEKRSTAKAGSPHSKIILSELASTTKFKMRKISFLRDLALHFFSYYVADQMPEIVVSFNGDTDKLRDFISSKVEGVVSSTIEVVDPEEETSHTLTIKHLYAESTLSSGLKNRLLFTAHGRVVGDPTEIERKFALNELPDSKCYVGVVSGSLLDSQVDQERMSFKLPSRLLNEIHSMAIDSAGFFLADHIAARRTKQAQVISDLLIEHPQLAIRVEKVDNYLETLSPGMDEEQIGENLFVHLYREERKVSQKLQSMKKSETVDEKFEEDFEELRKNISEQAKNRLAEVVVKRRQILDLLSTYRKINPDSDGKKYHLENAVHDLICPLGHFYGGADYSDHNLWILDDLLAFYHFFASDKTITSFTTNSDSTKEPDAIFFNPLGFRREGTDDPVAIVEFKRPGKDKVSGNPVDQVLAYIEKLRDKTVVSPDGSVISNISDKTRFECHVVVELDEATRKLIKRSIAAYETPDGEGYFGFAPEHNATIHVLSYRKLLSDAEKRHEVFFKKLGLLHVPKVSSLTAV
ncbi:MULTISPECIES: ATP-binding protein [Hyphomonas]|jgi:hypothetical protein